MLRDVFYYGKKPNVHPREKFANNLEDARSQSTTEHFWIINEFCDYKGFDWDFDFEFLPDEDVWAENHNNVWPSFHQKDSGTWLCPKEPSDVIVYRADVGCVSRKKEIDDHWVLNNNIDKSKFDFSWHPDPTDPPFIYVWGNQWYSGTIMPTVEYHVEGATEYKYITSSLAILNEDISAFDVFDDIENFDYSWTPNPTSPPYIYAWGNQWNKPEDKIAVQYVVEGATEYKYMGNRVKRKANYDNWHIPDNINCDEFDFSWEPSPADPAFIYEFATQWQKTGGPRYIVEGATEVKYIDLLKVKVLPSKENWTLPSNIDITDFDFSWHPDATSPPYIYYFPTQWALSGGPVYTVPGATEVKYVEDIVAKAIPDKTNWEVPSSIDSESFDYSWHPYAEDEPYIYQFGTQHQKTGGPRYITPGVHKNSATKYIDTRIVKAHRLPNKKNFAILNNLLVSEFDFSWHPDETEEPYIYVFGNQHYPPEIMPTVEYAVPGAKQIKYVSNVVAKLKVNMSNWEVPDDVDTSEFDFSWRPNPKEPPYIYQFPTQWQKTGGPRYVVTDATEVKYVDFMKVNKMPSEVNWEYPSKVKIKDFDTSWHPDDTETPYIYQFGTQWVLTGGPRYITPKATETKFIDIEEHHAVADVDMVPWIVPEGIDKKSFDFSWHPHPDDPPFVYQFGTQWQKTDGPKYVAEDAEDGFSPIKYIDTRIIKARKLPSRENWVIPEGFDASKFDFSWHPDANSPPYIYQFGTIADPQDGPRYVVADATEVVNMERVEVTGDVFIDYPKYFVETTLEALVEQHKGEVFWALNSQLDYTDFDFNWRPDIQQAHYVHAFGSSESETTQTYFINANMWANGYRELNWVKDEKLDEQTLAKLFKKPDMFFVDKGNKESQVRFDQLKAKFPAIQKTRYLNSWVDTINRCINRASTNLCWILNSELDYSNFNFDYYPNPWQMKMVQVFGTQWSHWGTTFMVNRETFSTDTKYVKIIEHLPNLNFIKQQTANATNCLYDSIVIDHGNKETTKIVNLLKSKMPEKEVTKFPYTISYLETFKELLKTLPEKREHYLWVCSSICDYTGFDFTYICDPFAKEQLHVFPSEKQKFGDTFLVNVNKLRELVTDMSQLEEYKKINYNQHQRVKRLPAPSITTALDTHVSSIDVDFDFPYAVFTTTDNTFDVHDTEPMSIWAPEHKNIMVTSVGGTRIVVPKEAKEYVKRELYDYPYIKTNTRLEKSTPMDIVFLSNGETGADENYNHLLAVTKGLPNRVVRVDGVNGRVAAYHAAAEASTTPWMFTVFAKLKVSSKFDWNWQPDRLQIPKHYVFHAKNPVNGLNYGHQAMIAYNKKLTLANQGMGLDFTMDDEHEVVKINSGVAVFNTDAWSTWRTSFREALKLRADPTDISKERLEFWLTVGSGPFSQYSMDGAQHAVEYYNEVEGDLLKLRLSYEWDWLRQKFEILYK